MVLGDLMGFSESDYAYNQSRAHSADMFFVKMRFWFWGSCSTLFFFLVGNILGVVLEISIMGWLIDGLKSIYGGH
tara:strand:+ start:700 stop:924 length:225 start_codon:yes stop_codon:yes gene_type:complete